MGGGHQKKRGKKKPFIDSINHQQIRLETAEEKIRKLEEISREIQNEERKKSGGWGGKEQILSDLGDNIKWSNICITGVSELGRDGVQWVKYLKM